MRMMNIPSRSDMIQVLAQSHAPHPHRRALLFHFRLASGESQPAGIFDAVLSTSKYWCD